jgi:hypothetical protein
MIWLYCLHLFLPNRCIFASLAILEEDSKVLTDRGTDCFNVALLFVLNWLSVVFSYYMLTSADEYSKARAKMRDAEDTSNLESELETSNNQEKRKRYSILFYYVLFTSRWITLIDPFFIAYNCSLTYFRFFS